MHYTWRVRPGGSQRDQHIQHALHEPRLRVSTTTAFDAHAWLGPCLGRFLPVLRWQLLDGQQPILELPAV